MLFWIVIGVLTVAVLGAVAWPLFRAPARAEDGSDYDIEVFRDQLAEIGREFAEGRLSREEAEAARAEIARRILAADARREPASVPAAESGDGGRTALAAVLAVVVAGGAAAVYLRLGAPDQPAVPFAAREAERAQMARANTGAMDLAALADRLRQRLERGEGNADGWQLLGRTYMQLGQYGNAGPAFERALGLGAGGAALQSSYGEALTLAAEGSVTPAAQVAFKAALADQPTEPTARYYLALAQHQAGAHREALDAWAALMADSPADAPWIDLLRERAAEAAAKLGIDVATALPQPKPPAEPLAQPTQPGAPGPSQEDVAAAQSMSPADRQQMIRGMVDGLAAKLEANPADFQGWMRLIRAYGVLGEKARAEAALGKALAQFEKAPFVRQQLLALAGEQGLAAPGGSPAPQQPAEPPRGPTAEQMREAQSMSPEDRQQMIRGMVDGLAAKLEANPADFQGWMRLIRSYGVLGEKPKAEAALSRALMQFANAPVPRQQLVALGGELGLALPEGSPKPPQLAEAPRGPTAGQMRDAEAMSPEDRRQMIEGMVEGLAARLEENPGDLQGWVRLARSYSVLGKPEAARDAMAKAAAVAPENVEILTLQARTIRAAAGDKPTPESLAIMQKVLTLDPDNVEALFFTGLAAANAGDANAARAAWQKARDTLPEGSRERAALQRRIDALGK